MRTTGWEKRLRDALAPWQTRPFAWGTADCGCLVADAAMAVAQCADPMAALRDRYTTAQGNARLLKSLGFASPADFVASTFAEVPHALARRGDIGVVGADVRAPLVVVMGPVLLGIGDTGLVSLPRAQLTRAFAVG